MLIVRIQLQISHSLGARIPAIREQSVDNVKRDTLPLTHSPLRISILPFPSISPQESSTLAVSEEATRLAESQFRPLQFRSGDIKFVPATPVKRRGRSMSRRTGQNGHIEVSGKWWVVRWWMDVPE